LATFFPDFFGINTDDLNEVRIKPFPTFEEVLGVIEIANSQGEGFREWGAAGILDAQRKPRIQHLHDVLVFLIAETLDVTLQKPAINHPKLIKNLEDAKTLQDYCFISLNYDILIDNALLGSQKSMGLDLDNGIEFLNFGLNWQKPRPAHSVRLLKLHGSLNWLYCPTCRGIAITPKEKGVCRLKWQPNECLCEVCQSVTVPIIIPPTFFKTLSNYFIRQIWYLAEQELMQCDRIVFCGYSFPEADVHIRYLLKRVEVNRQQRPPDVFIVNGPASDGGLGQSELKKAEKVRYGRFLKSRVFWTDEKFEEFCGDPSLIVTGTHERLR
jgi:NAD-dependent SIR2 family protein deacetylase